MAYDRYKITLAARMHLQDGKAIIRIMKGNAFDRARKGLQGRLLIGLCGSEHLIQGACWDEFPASLTLSLDGAADEVVLLRSHPFPPNTESTGLADSSQQAQGKRQEVKA